MTVLTTSAYLILSGLATQLGLKPVWSTSSGDAASDVNGWLAYALSDQNRSAQMASLREQVRVATGANITPDEKRMFEYYRGLLDSSSDPGRLPGLAMWMDGRAQTYSDTAGTAPSSAYAGRVRRTDQPAPLTGFLQSNSTAASGYREINAVNLQTGGNQSLLAPAVMPALTVSAVTYAGSFVARDNPPGGPNWLQSGYDNTSAINGVILFSNNFLTVYVAGISTITNISCPSGAQVSYVARCGSTGFKISAVVDGVRSDAINVGYPVGADLLNTISTAQFWIGTKVDYLGQGFHGAVSQAAVYSRAISDVESDALLSWLVGNQPTHYAPTQVALIMLAGDSIARGLNLESDRGDMWCFKMLAGLNATQPVNLVNQAISGSPISQMAGEYATKVQPFFSAARARNVLIVAGGTNNLATLGQDGPTALAEYYAYCDTALATGFRVVVCSILPRIGTGHDPAFATARAYFNSHLAAEYAARGYRALADVAAIPGMGADGDAANLTYYSDGIHPTIAGDALLSPVYAAATQLAIN